MMLSINIKQLLCQKGYWGGRLLTLFKNLPDLGGDVLQAVRFLDKAVGTFLQQLFSLAVKSITRGYH